MRNLKRAAKSRPSRSLQHRPAHNPVERAGHPAAYRVAELTAELEHYLAANMGMAVEVSGEQAEPLERALIEGLTAGRVLVVGSGPGAAMAELLITGTVRMWPIQVPDPQFRYVRWCTDAVIEEVSTHRVIGAVSKAEKKGM